MKNIFIILFLLLLCLSMLGCNNAISGDGNDSQSLSETIETTVPDSVSIYSDSDALPDNIHTEYDGFYITLGSVSEKSISVTWHNYTNNENITFGEYYHVEIYKNDTWESVPWTDELTVRSIAYTLPANGGQKKMSFSLSHLDMSEPGTYRVRCEFYDNGNKYNTWVEFEVPIK